MKKLLASLLLAGLAGCASHGNTGMWARHDDIEVETVPAPKADRCDKFKGADSMFHRCEEFKQQATNYLHGLNTGDTVCMEGGFGEEMSDKCKARAQVVDADNHGLLVQMREPQLDSHWKNYDGKRIFFENGALIDLYLKESGFE